ncbi:pentatricopeptide repeat-containing protein At3g09040, mitochondrial-like [Punica granatum]|uniref:Pentatricopeptide repeat-containing protein At3g09040, mitochondrial-like n=2 Tax=Punica granatum TaxID=22663 RepID=A0A6P8BT83_PUNGR|nr:pentatricopeptide repeat-containing protein At3g09040, mitochondrial-like [Punica granatum]XP_031372926.1 pentatricopeptide repeat-containing protein At3g09040, mitochondrial-like [Punica granatum]PKI63973.1 hypothetical protein CRG98_015649 [Punica granatum]
MRIPSKLKESLTFAIPAGGRSSRSGFTCPFSSCSSLSLPKDAPALAARLSRAADSKSLLLGMQLHAQITKWGFISDIFSQNQLILMYTKCSALKCGLEVFEQMPHRNLFSWTLLLSGAVQVGELELGLVLLSDMTRHRFLPNEFALGSALKICIDLSAFEMGMSIHGYAVKIGVERNPFVGSSMLNFYSRLGSIEEAEAVFCSVNNPDTGCWNAMAGAYADCGLGLKAVELVSLMQAKGVHLDEFTFANALKGCSLVGYDNYGRELHGLIVCSELGFSTSISNTLLHMYLKTGRKDSALKVFNMMHEKDIITWNTMFSSVRDDARSLVHLFHKFMSMEMKPNSITFSILLRRCGDISDLSLGLQFCCLVLQSGLFSDSKVTRSLINMFSNCGAMSMAHSIFDCISSKSTCDVNELISGYNLTHCYMEALRVFCHLSEFGIKADECTFSSILESCCRSGNEKMGNKIHCAILKFGFSSHGYICSSLVKLYATVGRQIDAFRCLRELKRSDLTCWGSLVSTLVHHGCSDEAMHSMKRLMESGDDPDEFILGSIFNGCANMSSLHQTKSAHSLAVKMGHDTHRFIASSVIDAYAKCGDVQSARMAFDHSSDIKDVVIYNSMIMGYAHNGLVVEAMEIFDKMKLANLQLSQATFVSAISACSHMGFLYQGCLLFQSMKSEYGMEPSPDIYGCIVDMLSRSGYLVHAKTMIEEMPFPPWPGILRSLLSGSRVHGNIAISKWAYEKLLQLVPENDAAHILLSSVYSEAGSWEDAAFLQRDMIDKGISKSPGHSWIQMQ